MFELEKNFSFEACHTLDHHEGLCKNLHGHSYRLIIKMRKEELNTSGAEKNMVTDFGRIKEHVKPLIEKYLDHHHLNETLETDSPTAEFIAQWTFLQLKPTLPEIYSVTVWETATSAATYQE
jgi:6-pyruvoyltetrahydropterin/6-carboxytetrahydropterin synthase